MRRSNTLLCLSMAFILVATIFIPNKVKATDDDLVIKDGVLTAYLGSDIEVMVPEGVTSIGDKAFYRNVNITKITIPYSVTRIGSSAFESFAVT